MTLKAGFCSIEIHNSFRIPDCTACRWAGPYDDMTQDFTIKGVHVVRGRARGSGDGSPPVGSTGKAPVGGLGNFVPRSYSKYEISVQFFTFSCRKFRI